jgi:hypothetical protein
MKQPAQTRQFSLRFLLFPSMAILPGASAIDPSSVKNKLKRQDIAARQKHVKNVLKKKQKQRRDKVEAENPELKEVFPRHTLPFNA